MKLMQTAFIKRFLVAGIILLTAVIVGRYLQAHPEYIRKLLDTNPSTVLWLLVVNLASIAILALIYQVTVQIAAHKIAMRENILLTLYSTIANFFGPLQSGPGVRAAYLRSKHQIPIRRYTAATLLYYACYASTSAFFLFVGTRPWWQTLLIVLAAAIISYGVIHIFNTRTRHQDSQRTSILNITKPLMVTLFGLTFVQLLLLAFRYYIGVVSIDQSITFGQALSYAGAANFALFAAITPDGIGIREGFLVASQSIHGIETATIMAASLLDRANYILYLGVLFALAAGLHAKKFLGLKQFTKQPTLEK